MQKRDLISLPAGLLLLAVSVFDALPARADIVPYNGAAVAPNIAIITVEDDGIAIDLEIYVEDIGIFAGIVPADLTGSAKHLLPDAEERVRRFGRETFRVLDDKDAPLALKVNLVEPRMRVDRASPLAGERDPVTGQIVPSPPAEKRVLFAELFYAFGATKPDTVTFVPPPSNGEAVASIGMQVNDRSVPVTEFRFLSKPATLQIDWQDPWHSRLQSPPMNRRLQNGTTSFLYVAPREVRHEILIRLRELAPWIGEAFQTGETLDSARQASILDAGMTTLHVRNPLSIEGENKAPGSFRARFLTLDAQGFQIVDTTRTLNVDNTFMGLILSYPHVDLPPDVTVTWDMFDDQISKVPMTLTDDAGPFLDQATKASPAVTWTNFLKTYVNPQVRHLPADGVVFLAPVWQVMIGTILAACVGVWFGRTHRARLALTLVGAAALSGVFFLRDHRTVTFLSPFSGKAGLQLAEDALPRLLDNVYVAALEVTPKAREAALYPVVTSASVADLSAELEGNLAIRIAGGERARVKTIRDASLHEGQMNAQGVYRGIASWSVDAEADHWGHNHRRRVTYRAQIEIVPEDGNWKLAALTVLEARSPDV